MSRERLRGLMPFALVGVLLILSFFVLHGTAAGVAAFAAFLGLIAACIDALRRKDADVRRDADRSGLARWFGGGVLTDASNSLRPKRHGPAAAPADCLGERRSRVFQRVRRCHGD